LKKRDLVIYKSLIGQSDSARGGRSIDTVLFAKKMQDCRKKKITIITSYDKDYPESLKQIPDHPELLYCRGNTDLLREKYLVSMVGSRRATAYGLGIAGKFSREIASSGVTVVSGMALGIDATCHRGALAAKGETIAVLGTAIDNLYPRENERLGRQIIESGNLVVSEYPPGFWTAKFNFPMRNRIIAGLSRSTVVVEASRKSGALITALLALDYNRNLYAVPSDLGKLSGEGSNYLISRGAICLVSAGMVLEDLGLLSIGKEANLTDQESLIMQMVKSGDNFDKMTKKLKTEPDKLNVILLNLEIKGLVKRTSEGIKAFD
jgi:DNA processing protein